MENLPIPPPYEIGCFKQLTYYTIIKGGIVKPKIPNNFHF